jgi:hypothetical protein
MLNEVAEVLPVGMKLLVFPKPEGIRITPNLVTNGIDWALKRLRSSSFGRSMF